MLSAAMQFRCGFIEHEVYTDIKCEEFENVELEAIFHCSGLRCACKNAYIRDNFDIFF